MKKQNFLISSFQKALNKPKTALFKDFILCYRNSLSGFIFTCKSICNFTPYFISTAELNELTNKLKHDIKRNSALNAEIETFNHYFGENIVIEQKSKKYADICFKLGLHNLSRQSAQIKCLAATLFPIDFIAKIPEISRKFANLEEQVLQCFQKNHTAVKTIIIDDFIFSYEETMHQWRVWDLFFPQNKKILQRRVREIINNLQNNQPLPADFADGNVFRKPTFALNHGENYRASYVDSLLYLSEKIVLMKNYDDLLKLAHEKVQNMPDFTKELQYFHNSNYSPDLDDINQIRRIAQKLYEKFARICYFNAIVKSFEIFYNADYPLERNPALPSVAPEKEIKKIEKIVERAQTIAAKGKLAKEFNSSLHSFEQTAEELQAALNRYNKTSFV